MATVTKENIGLLHEKLTVKLEKTDYLPSFEKALQEYSKKANIPGFRKGMVPTGLIKKMYGPSLFTDEVLFYTYWDNLTIFERLMTSDEGREVIRMGILNASGECEKTRLEYLKNYFQQKINDEKIKTKLMSADSVGFVGKASALSPTPSWSLSFVSATFVGNASELSPTPSPSVSTDSLGSVGNAS